MKTIILAGGLGTRLQEETVVKPKPMVEIGGLPMLWHIMKIYSSFGVNEFAIAMGYKSEVIRDYFLNYHYYHRNLTVNLSSGDIIKHDGEECEDWTVYLANTGANTQTGGRLKRFSKWIGGERFMATYGDGVADIDINKLIEFHKDHGKLATITAVRPPSRFGNIQVEDDKVKGFVEKPQIGEGWINGGFFVLEPEVLDYIDGDDVAFERYPMEKLASDGQLMAYRHNSFWQCMDTIRDVNYLEEIWDSEQAPWKVW